MITKKLTEKMKLITYLSKLKHQLKITIFLLNFFYSNQFIKKKLIDQIKNQFVLIKRNI